MGCLFPRSTRTATAGTITWTGSPSGLPVAIPDPTPPQTKRRAYLGGRLRA